MKILISEDHRLFAKGLGNQLKQFGEVSYAQTLGTSLNLIKNYNYDVAFIDLNLDVDLAGLDIIKAINIIIG